jgi:hypothetical protein
MANVILQKTKNMVMIIDGIKNLLEVEDVMGTHQLLQKIQAGEKVMVSIYLNSGQYLVHEQKKLLRFDVCRSGQPQYNAVSVIRDILKANHSHGQWTRKKVEALLTFETQKTR